MSKKPFWVLALALVGISFAGPLVRLSTADPVVIAIWRLGFSLIVVFGFLIPTGEWREWRRLTVGELALAVVAGASLALHFWAWNASIHLTTIAASVTLVNLQPAFVAAISALALREPPELVRDVEHPHVHPVLRLVDAGRVEEDHLAGVVVPDADDAVPGRLGLVGDDRELGADKSIEERRLSGIRPADERDEPELHDAATAVPAGSPCRSTREIRTRFTRRRSASMISMCRPSRSTCSPGAGTRPRCARR